MPTIRTNDIETYYERRGTGPPLIFIHGAVIDDHTSWMPQVDRFSNEYTTFTYDIRGHGRTGGSHLPSYSISLFADDLEAFIDGLGLEQPILCGFSMGGMVAQTYAARHPDRVGSLIIADSLGPYVFTRRERIARVVFPKIALPIVRIVGYDRLKQSFRWILMRMYGKESDQFAEVERLPSMDSNEVVKVLRAPATFHQSNINLSAIPAPTLILFGDHGLPYMQRHAAKLAAEIADAVVESIPATTHMLNVNNPEAFNAAIREFLE